VAFEDFDNNPRTLRHLPLAYYAGRTRRHWYGRSRVAVVCALTVLAALVYWLRLPR